MYDNYNLTFVIMCAAPFIIGLLSLIVFKFLQSKTTTSQKISDINSVK